MAMDERGHGLSSISKETEKIRDKRDTNLRCDILRSKSGTTAYDHKIDPIGAVCPVADGALDFQHIIGNDLDNGLAPVVCPFG